MRRFRLDLHVHTLLSPCAGLEMSPSTIVRRAAEAGLDALAVTDHNTTLQTPEVARLGRERGIAVFYGAELTTREEAHLIALLPDAAAAAELQEWIDRHICRIPNRPGKLGDQVWVDEHEMIAGEVAWCLNAPLRCSAEQTAAEVRRLGGLLVAAHVDRPSNSLIGQLGFLPPGMPLDGVEYNRAERFAELLRFHPDLALYPSYTASDAHFSDQIGERTAMLRAEAATFAELKRAFACEGGRRIGSMGEPL